MYAKGTPLKYHHRGRWATELILSILQGRDREVQIEVGWLRVIVASRERALRTWMPRSLARARIPFLDSDLGRSVFARSGSGRDSTVSSKDNEAVDACSADPKISRGRHSVFVFGLSVRRWHGRTLGFMSRSVNFDACMMRAVR